MDKTSLLEIDDALCAAIAFARTASAQHPDQVSAFRRIIAMLWSARDELDLIVSRPPSKVPTAVQAQA